MRIRFEKIRSFIYGYIHDEYCIYMRSFACFAPGDVKQQEGDRTEHCDCDVVNAGSNMVDKFVCQMFTIYSVLLNMHACIEYEKAERKIGRMT